MNGFRSFVTDMKTDFPTIEEFMEKKRKTDLAQTNILTRKLSKSPEKVKKHENHNENREKER